MTRKLNILLSAYACEPGKGSEPEVGWRVALEIAQHCHVQVLTRANNREAIEACLKQLTGPKPEFLYYDLPPIWLWMKRHVLGTSGYYILWQAAIRWKFRRKLRNVDLLHHVTFNGFQVPGFWCATDTPVVLGPLGGGMKCPKKYLGILGPGKRRERSRSLLIQCIPFLPWWQAAIANASLVIAANRETAELLQPHRNERIPVMLETAIPEASVVTAPHRGSSDRSFKILWLGNLIPRKAPILAVKALHRALKYDADITLVIAGAGPEDSRLREEARILGVETNITFLGKIPKSDVEQLMDHSDAFLFTSVRDTSGNVVLEAMSRGLPVIALWHQGVREICDSDCAVIVFPSSVESTIDDMANAMISLHRDARLAERISLAGIQKIGDRLTWQHYGNRMVDFYRQVLKDQSTLA